MEAEGIERVVCLLTGRHFRPYDDQLGSYRARFGDERVLHAPTENDEFADPGRLAGEILPSLVASDDADDPVVVHCSAGSGRTGDVLAAWLVLHSGYSPTESVQTVHSTGRDPPQAGPMAEFEAPADRL